ncbi:hypothetical protein [Bacteroides sp.]|uniref:hypothetical protein n=1 Tax=Bacteroides sp. TaxID=29523 RepID=UPI0025C2996A|nr:hypothetical protein [Bacteroides sp.]
MKQKDFLFGLLGCLVMVCAVFVACSASVENTPEGVATLAINNYVKGTLPDVQEYATEYQHGLLKDWTQETVDYQKKLYKGASVEFLKVSDYAADGSMKDASFKIHVGEKEYRMCVRVVNENGKWLFDSIK